MNITKEEFDAYENVRASGVTNMFAVNVVEDLSGLSRDKIIFIMKNYGELKKKYMSNKKEKDELDTDEETKGWD